MGAFERYGIRKRVYCLAGRETRSMKDESFELTCIDFRLCLTTNSIFT
jgi:hypothetical protein